MNIYADEFKLDKNKLGRILIKYLPETLYTLGKEKVFFAKYVGDGIVKIHGPTINKDFYVNFSDLIKIYDVVSCIRSFRIADYKPIYTGKIQQLRYILPIIRNLMSFSSLEIDNFYPPGERRKRPLNYEDYYIQQSLRKSKGLFRIIIDGKPYEAADLADLKDAFGFEESEINYSHMIKKEVAKKEKPPYSEVEIYYVTNRSVSPKKSKIFDDERGECGKIYYGKSIVTIPRDHKSGNLERPSIFKLEFSEDSKKHFTISGGVSLSFNEYFKSIRGAQKEDSVMIFVHGYNVSFKDGLYKAAQLRVDLNYKDPLILFSWPSKGTLFKYTHDKTNAEYSSSDFTNLIESLKSEYVKTIYVVAHSMGSLCASMGLSNINSKKNKNLDYLVLAAPDVDAGTFEKLYASKLTKLFKNITIYASDTDKALNASNKVNGYRRLGHGNEHDGIVVIDKIDSIDATGMDDGFLSLAHSYYSESKTVVDDIYHNLFNKLPPIKRNLRKEYNPESKLYWKFAL